MFDHMDVEDNNRLYFSINNSTGFITYAQLKGVDIYNLYGTIKVIFSNTIRNLDCSQLILQGIEKLVICNY